VFDASCRVCVAGGLPFGVKTNKVDTESTSVT
jgi:hypothetical protein